jgi:DNA polymerase-3 subunit epsilon
MSDSSEGIFHQRIQDTPVAVLDFETTGLSPGYDRVVEVSVVRVDPGAEPRLVFDSLVNPGRRMAATEIHGIRDRDVADAPRFEDLAGDLLCSLSGCLVAAHNVYFDLRFLRFELDRLGRFQEFPHLCTMYSRPLIGLLACGLDEACRVDRVGFTPTHSSRSDSTAAALLWVRYRDAFMSRGVLTFRDLTLMGRKYKFLSSFRCGPLPLRRATKGRAALKPRSV